MASECVEHKHTPTHTTHTHTHTRARAHAHAHTRTHAHTHMHTHAHAHAHAHTHTKQAQPEYQSQALHAAAPHSQSLKFSKVILTVMYFSKLSRELTFENSCKISITSPAKGDAAAPHSQLVEF